MALRVQLLSDTLGSLIIEKADPIDINALTQTVKRSDENDGVIFEVILDLEFIKEGRQFIKQAYDTTGGIDAEVNVNIYEFDPNSRRWQLYATGQINFNNFELTEDRVKVAIEQTGFERRVLSMLEKDVDLETIVSENGSALSPIDTHLIPYHSKILLKQLNREPVNSVAFQQLDVGTFSFPNTGADYTIGGIWYGQFDNSSTVHDDLSDNFTTPYGWIIHPNPLAQNQIPGSGSVSEYVIFLSDASRKTLRNPMYVAMEEGVMGINLKLTYKHKVTASNTGGDVDIGGDGALGNVEINAWVEHRDINDNIISLSHAGEWNIPGIGGFIRESAFETKFYNQLNVVVNSGDSFFVYNTYRVWGTYEAPGIFSSDGHVHHDFTITADKQNTHFIFINRTSFRTTISKTFFLYDAAERCTQYITNQQECFKSDLLGRTERGYLEDGKGALLAITNGHFLRERNEKQIFSNLKDLIDLSNSLFCTGFGFEKDETGKQVLRLEHKSHFFNKNNKILSLGKVYNITRRIDSKRFYNSIEIGYTTKMDIKQTNAIDEFNTVRRFSIPVVNAKNSLKVGTKIKAGGYQIEAQRRLAASTEDGKGDDDNFIVVLIRDGLTYRTKKNEGYELIDNIFDAASGYNYDISPARNLKNWLQVIASSLIRSARKIIAFSYGEVNYEMITRKVGETSNTVENGEIDLTFVQPIWDNEIYSFTEHPLTREEFKLVKNNPYGYIEFQDLYGEIMNGYVLNIEHDSNKNLADFELLKVSR